MSGPDLAADTACIEAAKHGVDLDPRWSWVEVTALGDRTPQFVKTGCNHLDVIPVHDVTGDLVARLCRTCDEHWRVCDGVV